jgi:hypothetical protein
MPIPLPVLDDRRWTDLVEEGRSLIPLYAPGWTDWNVHDPGITLVELLAWVAERDLYWLDQVPAERRRKFLALAGMAPHPPRAARVVVAFAAAGAGGTPPVLPADLELAGEDLMGVRTVFRTLQPLTVGAARLAALQVAAAAAPAADMTAQGAAAAGPAADMTARRLRGEPVPLLGEDPRPGAALYLGFDQALPAGQTLSLYFSFAAPRESAESGAGGAGGRQDGPSERERLIAEARLAAAACPPPAGCCGPAARGGNPAAGDARGPAAGDARGPAAGTAIGPGPGAEGGSTGRADAADAGGLAAADAGGPGPSVSAPEPRVPPHASVRLAWEIAIAPAVWRQLDEAAGEAADDTRALTLDGQVTVSPPVAMARQRLGGVKDELYYLRCRFVAGAYDAAPVLADLAVHAVLAEQAESLPETPFALQPQPPRPPATVLATELGRGSGAPHQELAFPKAPVLAETLEMLTVEEGRLVRWAPRIDFDASRRADAHVVVDLQQGSLRCGDGEAGRTIPPGAPFLARYRATRAADGNLPAGRIAEIAGTPHNRALTGLGQDALAALRQAVRVSNPRAASGGAAAESVAAAAARAAAEMTATARAVTLGDYERLALAAPGTRIARATARANFDPAFPCLEAIGVVTVIVLPYLPLARPFPSAGLLRAVGAYLRRRRLVGTRVVVSAPAYREVAVEAAVRALPRVDPAALLGRITAALDGFFHPLTGGPHGQGWPFGRAVYRAEVMQVLSEVPGVDSVSNLALLPAGGAAVCGNLCLAPTELVAAGRHQIQIG